MADPHIVEIGIRGTTGRAVLPVGRRGRAHVRRKRLSLLFVGHGGGGGNVRAKHVEEGPYLGVRRGWVARSEWQGGSVVQRRQERRRSQK